MKLKEAIEIYLNSRSKRLAKNSLATYRRVLQTFLHFVGEDRLLECILEREVDAFQLSLLDRVSVNTQINYANILRPFFRYWSIRSKTSLLYDAIEGPRKEEKQPDFITPEQFALIDDYHAEEEYNQLIRKLIFSLLWDTGMRIGELLSLNIADISSTQNFCTIRTEKTKKMRIVVWTAYTHELLMKYLGVRICINQDQPLFQTPNHRGRNMRKTRLSARSVQRWCQRLERELGFRVHPHAFRHGKMHFIINSGGTRQHVQTVAGHSSITSSEVYVRLNPMEQLRIQKRFLANRKPVRARKSTTARKSLQSPYRQV